MQKALLVVSLFCLATTPALAQTKISTTITCGKPDTQQMIPVDDHAGHSYGVSHLSCTSTKPWTIAGVASKDAAGTSALEVDGAVTRNHGVYIETMENGDKAYYHYQLTATTKGDQMTITAHKWQLVGGTGKLKGVKGSGTCKGGGTADSMTYDCDGEYTMPK